MEEKGLVIKERQELALPDSATLEQELKAVRAFQATVSKLLIEGHDYGVIPGTTKPTLLKPGAEKIDKILHLADTYEITNQVEEWDKGFFYYQFRCRLIIIGTDIVVSEGMGSCNSKENKYRYRWVFESALPKGIDKADLPTKKVRVKGNWTPTYRIENENPQDLANTILKMGKKRAHIDATLSAGRLSDVFTQDIEDIDLASNQTAEEVSNSKVAGESKATAGQLKKIYALAKEKGWEKSAITAIMIRNWHTGSSKQLTKSQASELMDILEKGPATSGNEGKEESKITESTEVEEEQQEQTELF